MSLTRIGALSMQIRQTGNLRTSQSPQSPPSIATGNVNRNRDFFFLFLFCFCFCIFVIAMIFSLLNSTLSFFSLSSLTSYFCYGKQFALEYGDNTLGQSFLDFL